MALSENTDLSSAQSPSSPPADEQIQLPNLQTENAGDSLEPLQIETSPDVEEQEEKPASDGEIQPPMDGGDSTENKKRKTPEEEGGEKGSPHPLWKTSLCSYFRRQSGSCSHGDTCRYAHGEAELRPRPDSSWDPTSERAKKLLKSDGGERVEAPPEPREDVLPSLPTGNGDDQFDMELDKCLVHLPRKWASEHLKSFLNAEASGFLLPVLFSTFLYMILFALDFIWFSSFKEFRELGFDFSSINIGGFPWLVLFHWYLL